MTIRVPSITCASLLMHHPLILTIDLGTTSTRAKLCDGRQSVSGASVQIPNRLRPIPTAASPLTHARCWPPPSTPSTRMLVRSAATGSHRRASPWTALWATCSVWT
ncbi:MAG: hypothetical protein R2851_05965 [Caldilineaceae bacterium]